MENGQMNYVMGGNSISMAGTDSISDLTRKEAIKEFNKANKKAEDAYRKNIDKQIAKSNENKKRAEDLEIVPSGPYILVKLYNENPYEQITQTDSGLILPAFDGKEFSRETGQMEKQEKAIEIAHVIEVGPDVVNIQPGDDLFIRAGMLLPVPFLRQGFWVTGQNNVLVIINKGLTKRMEEYKNNKKDLEYIDISKLPNELGNTLEKRINKYLELKKNGIALIENKK